MTKGCMKYLLEYFHAFFQTPFHCPGFSLFAKTCFVCFASTDKRIESILIFSLQKVQTKCYKLYIPQSARINIRPLTNIEISSLMILCVTDCFSCISQKIRKFLLYCHQTLLTVLHVHNENYMPTGLIRFAANDSAMSSATVQHTDCQHLLGVDFSSIL